MEIQWICFESQHILRPIWIGHFNSRIQFDQIFKKIIVICILCASALCVLMWTKIYLKILLQTVNNNWNIYIYSYAI